MRYRSNGNLGGFWASSGIALFLLWLVCLSFACSSSKGDVQPMGIPAVPVTIAAAVSKDVPLQIRVIGTVEPYSTVAVKSMVNGELLRVYFTEGQEVKKGSQLFGIDPRPFEADLRRNEATLARDDAALSQARANLARDIAQAENASVEERRYEELVAKGVIAKEQ